jgi:XTP/dITP diphosphohydrolase
VFADTSAETAEVVAANWDEIKQVEKKRQSVTDGVPLGQPALALAAKLVSRADRASVSVQPPKDGIGGKLLALAAEAVRAGIDPEQALRASAREYSEAIRREESSEPAS